MYTCGPTVYGRPHIGNYSSFLMADLLRRWLEVSGYQVTHVKNITDVGHLLADQDWGEDKIELQAKQEKADPLAIAKKYTEQYLEDEKALSMIEPFARPKATETIKEMIGIIEKLIVHGNAYETNDGVYFAVETFPQYGKLSGNTLDALRAGSRIEVKEQKRNPADFALWKKLIGANAQHILHWDSPFGEGFPGWHIECSAMSRKFLGEHIDIHTGGEDNIFPHHECEIAQSECSFTSDGDRMPFARYWLHKRRIDLGEAKMSKSIGNILTIPDVTAKGFSSLDLRYYLLSVHYRTNLKFSWKGLDDAKKARKKIQEWVHEIRKQAANSEQRTVDSAVISGRKKNSDIVPSSFIENFASAMNEDLNTPAALANIFETMAWSRREVLSTDDESALLIYSAIVDQTFGFLDASEMEKRMDIPPAVTLLLDERSRARGQKNFTEADRLRDEIASQGFTVRDSQDGQQVQAS